MIVASQDRSQETIPFRLYVILALASLLLLQVQFLRHVSAQEVGPITKRNLVRALANEKRQKGKMTSAARYIQLIRKHGVTFQITPSDEQDIRKAGSYLSAPQLDELIDAVRTSYRSESVSLSGIVEQVEVIQNPGGGAQVFIRLLIRNDGLPTIAQKYHLHIRHITSKSIEFKGSPVGIHDSYTLPQAAESKEIIIQPQDALTHKTDGAIAQGGVVSGWLRFVLPHPPLKPEFLRQRGIQYTVSFADVTGNSYKAVYEVR